MSDEHANSKAKSGAKSAAALNPKNSPQKPAASFRVKLDEFSLKASQELKPKNVKKRVKRDMKIIRRFSFST